MLGKHDSVSKAVMRKLDGWKEFKEMFGIFCGRMSSCKASGRLYQVYVISMVCYEAECLAIKAGDIVLTCMMEMIWIMCGKTPLDKIVVSVLKEWMDVEDINEYFREHHLVRLGHLAQINVEILMRRKFS